MNDTIVGLDLAKSVFHTVELSGRGKQPARKKHSRDQLKRFFANRQPVHISMEACSSAHYWARLLRDQGHSITLLPPQHVKGYARGQKNDYNDALAIAEAAAHGSIRPVPIKSIAQQDLQALHRMRQLCVAQRTALINQIRGLLAENGVVVNKGVATFRRQIPRVLEDATNGLTDFFRALIAKQYEHFLTLDDQADWLKEQMVRLAQEDETCRRLLTIPGFGPIVASAVAAWMGDGKQFSKGRHAAAATGLVPRQHTSGDKIRLSGVTKRGDSYVRYLLVTGARTVVIRAAKKTDALSRWVTRLVNERGINKAIVALANKLARMAWVVITKGECYRSLEERGLATAPAL